MMLLANGFQKLLAGNLSIEDARDRVRTHLHQLNSEKFQWGTHGTSIADLAHEMFKKVNGVETWHQCNQCQFQTKAFDDDHMYIINSTTICKIVQHLKFLKCDEPTSTSCIPYELSCRIWL